MVLVLTIRRRQAHSHQAPLESRVRAQGVPLRAYGEVNQRGVAGVDRPLQVMKRFVQISCFRIKDRRLYRRERLGRDRFFQGMSVVLLLIVLIGFARTLFLRPLTHVPSIPWYLYAHGIVLTCWFTQLVAQTSLIALRRTDLHRRLGIVGAILAIAVLGISLFTVLSVPHRLKTGHLSNDPATAAPLNLAAASPIVWTDLAALGLFSTLVGTALLLRRRPEAHRRLMLLASISIIGPAAGRVAALAHLWTGIPFAETAIGILGVFGLPLTLIVHDLIKTRRLHPAATWGTAGYYVAMFGAFAVSNSAAGVGLLKALQ
jgi:hypothetical protein